MVDAVAHGARELWPASLVLEGEYSVDGVALSVPVSLGAGAAACLACANIFRVLFLDASEAPLDRD